jgi:hypothetical protein
MSDKGSIPKAHGAGYDQPLLLLARCDPLLFGDEVFEPFLRRMGLEPTLVTPMRPAATLFDGGCFEVQFAEQRALTGRVSESAIGSAIHPSLSLTQSEVLACAPLDLPDDNRVSACREIFKLAVLLIDLTGADQLYWSPAGLWSDAWTFRAAVSEMLASGMPPVLHLVCFDPIVPDGPLRSRGLAFFSGQELEIRNDGGLQTRELIRRLARLAIDVMVNGAIHAPRNFPGLVSGEHVGVEPVVGNDGAVTLFVSFSHE